MKRIKTQTIIHSVSECREKQTSLKNRMVNSSRRKISVKINYTVSHKLSSVEFITRANDSNDRSDWHTVVLSFLPYQKVSQKKALGKMLKKKNYFKSVSSSISSPKENQRQTK